MQTAVMQHHDSSALSAFFGAGGLLPVWQLTQAQFEAHAICAAVDVVMRRGRLQLEPVDEDGQRALARLGQLAARHAPAGCADPEAWAAAGVERILSAVFQDDMSLGELPGIAHVVLVKKAQMDGLGLALREVVRRVHMRQIEDALRQGLQVPASIRDEYLESMERMHVLPATGLREILH